MVENFLRYFRTKGKDYNDTLVQYMQEYRAHCISMDDILEETR